MAKFIKLTSVNDSNPIYVNVEHLGHVYRVPEVMEYGKITEDAYTKIGVTTHNNGGFRVKETPEEILKTPISELIIL